MSIGHFLGGIAALIFDPISHKYLLIRRSSKRDFQAGAWECVTGRVDQGEGFEQALYREIREEVGVEVTVDFIIGTTHFYRGAPEPIYELLGVLYACSLVGKTQPHLSEEHSELRWVTSQEASSLLPEGHWLLKVIQRADLLRMGTPDWLLERFQQESFEI